MLKLILELEKAGVRLWVEDGERLRFSAKKGAMTPEIKARLKAEKEALIAFLNEAAGAAKTTEEPAVFTVPPGETRPLSFAQERLWFIEQLEPGNLVFLLPGAMLLEGDLNADLLETAIRQVIQRHESLRVSFEERDGRPHLNVAQNPDWTMAHADLTHLDGDARDGAAREEAAAFARRPFDLTAGPLLRVKLIALTQDQHLLLFNTHHIISDDWSSNIFLAEWIHIYNALAAGKPHGLPDLAMQYSDFAWWQRKRLDETARTAQLDYWRNRLAGLEPIDFPTDRPRPARQTYDGAGLGFEISEALTARLRQLARAEGVSMYMLLLAGFSALLSRYSGQDDVCVGSSIGNREHPALEKIIGMFVNLLAMRTHLSGAPNFRQLLKATRATTLEAYQNQDIPFEKVVEALGVVRDLSRHPLFQIQLVHTTAPAETPAMEGLQFKPFGGAEDVVSRVDFSVGFTEAETQMFGGIEYNTDLFDHATMQRVARHITGFLEAAVATPDVDYHRLTFMAEDERRQLAVWNQTQQPFPAGATLAAQFEAVVLRTPDAIALTKDDQTLTYAELNAAANRLSHYLIGYGVEPDMPVGICLKPGFDLITTLLAILKAGGAYVPLDPGYPGERLSYLMEDTGMSILVSDSDHIDNLPAQELNFINAVVLDEDEDMIAGESEDNPEVISGDLAYIVYTSGTTGRPKGVLVSQHNVLRLVHDRDYLAADADDRIAQVSNISFDAMTFEVWTALLCGARLCLVDKDTFIDPDAFAAEIRRAGINMLFTTTALFNQFARTVPDIFAPMKFVCFGGEQVDPVAVRAILDGGPPQHLRHVYGPTESTTFATWHPIDAVTEDTHNIPIGQPIANTTMHLLDLHLRQVPVGVVGEIFLGGEGLARGYHNRPDLTAERFVPNPLADTADAGSRLYRTGDLARRLPSGAVEFHGRRDFQVKVRGFRIELEEIETVLLRHSLVSGAVVLARSDDPKRPSDKRLAAYIRAAVAPEEKDGLVAELRQNLKESLPDYMIPAALVVLDEFPVTPNGKINRALLPAPDAAAVTSTKGYEAPRNAVEEKLVKVWCAVLGRDKIGIHDNFFELGGDSLLSIQIKAAARREGLDFELHQLFEYPTIAQLASHIEVTEDQTEITEEIAPFALLSQDDRARLPKGLDDAYPLSQLQLGLLYHGAYEQNSGLYHVALLNQINRPFNVEAMTTVLAGLTARHDMLRTCFDLDRFSRPMQLVYSSMTLPMEVQDLRGHQDLSTFFINWFEADKHKPFAWGPEPIIRVGIFLINDTTFKISLSFHHAVMDGWSNATLFTELVRDYTALVDGKPMPQTAALQCRYRDFVKQECDALENESCRRFWSNMLSDAPATLVPRLPHQGEDQTIYLEVPIPEAVSQGLHQLSKTANVPLKTVLLASHLKALSLYCGQEDVVTGLASNCRPEVTDSEKVIGLFVNTLPFRLHLNPGAWTDLVQQTFAAERDLMPNRHLPLSEIVAMQGGAALYDAVFNFTHFHVYRDLEASENEADYGLDGAINDTNFPLLLNYALEHNDSRVILTLTYDPKLFSRDWMERLTHHYARVLEVMALEPQSPHQHLELLGDQPLWDTYNQPRPLNVTQANLPARFAQTVLTMPHQTALSQGDTTLSYAELDRRTNHLATHLAQLGVGPDVPVGLCLPSSVEMIIAVLAVVKAGGAYMALDPNYPDQRLAFMIHDSATPVVITNADLEHRFQDMGAGLLLMDRHPELYDGTAPYFTAPALHTDNVANIIYTSGTTGRPKGVQITHGGILAMATENRYMQAQPDMGMAQIANTSFDAFTFELWTAFAHGCRLCIGSKDTLLDAAALSHFFKSQRIDILLQTTSLFNQMIREQSDLYKDISYLTVGGEKMDPSAAAHALAAGRPQHLLNLYGPSEATTFVCWFEVDQASAASGNVPIGQALTGAQLYVLGPDLKRVPVGTPGELHIAGAGLARGYLNRPDITADRFIPNPFADADQSGSRLYRTGDKVRFIPHGDGITLEYLERIDNQVKLRGFRIEPGEIEQHLRRLDHVTNAVVRVIDGGQGQRLFAWLETDGAEIADPRQELAADLPGFMMPSGFHLMDRFPLTANGKLDLKALPLPTADATEDTYVAPRTPTEEVLCGIWEEVLGLQPLGAHADFFENGGHSLSATRAVSRISDAFDLRIPIRALFENATPAAMAVFVETAVKEALQVEPISVEPVERDPAGMPLSYAQERLWFLDRLDPGSATYNMPLTFQLQGELDTQAFSAACTGLLARHESLRTRFGSRDDSPCQFIDPQINLSLDVVTLDQDTHARAEERCRQLVEKEAARPFDLAVGPLFRVTLYRLTAQHHVVLMNMHHIVSDGWSMNLLLGEWAALYHAAANQVANPLPEQQLQYIDFAAWQRCRLDGGELQRQLSWWGDQLQDAPFNLALSTDFPRPAAQTFDGDHVLFEISPETTAALRRVCRAEGTTLFMALLTAYGVMLSRYARQDDLCIGTPIANRTHAQLEGIVGFFVNTLVMRLKPQSGQSFAQLLQQVRRLTLDAYAHQDVPFEKLVDHLQPERDLSRSPLFQVFFSLANSSDGPAETPTDMLLPQAWGFDHRIAKFELSLYLAPVQDRLSGTLEYNTNLFRAQTVQAMVTHFTQLLDQLCTQPHRHIQGLAMLPHADRNRPASGQTGTETQLTLPPYLPHALARQAQRTPDAPALRFEGAVLDYRAFNARANQLAHHLTQLGVGPETPVALVMERSFEMVIAVFAVLKAGGYYVPLDPDQPAERLHFMLDDCRAGVILTQEHLADRLPASNAVTLTLDATWFQNQAEQTNPELTLQGDQAAYMIYTSGSTGRPKPVVNTHAAIATRLAWMQPLHQTDGAVDRYLQKTPYFFDVSTWELFLPCLDGSCLTIARPGGHGDPAYLAQTIRDHQINIIHFVPSMLRVFLEVADPADCVSLTHVYCSGEALPADLKDRCLEQWDVDLFNLYGPTEAAVDVTQYHCRHGNLHMGVPIGAAVPGTRLYILDNHLNPVPAGVPGELMIAGVQLARGYAGRADLTAERFIPAAVGETAGSRFYRTGDLVRLQHDGQIAFLGRLDYQVKVRGFRIELGEIEEQLRNLDQVTEAVVSAVQTTTRETRLLAHVQPATDVTPDDLRAQLAQRLPDYMVPEQFVLLAQFPLNASGKIDRRALPQPQIDERPRDAEKIPPRTPTEKLIAAVWCEMLERDEVYANDHFFRLGGHSLVAARVASRLEKELERPVPLRDLFEYPILADLATHLDRDRSGDFGPPALEPAPANTRLPLSFAQERLWFLEQLGSGGAVYAMVEPRRILGPLRFDLLEQALQAVIQRHDVYRTAFHEQGGEPYLHILPHLDWRLELLDLSDLPAEARAERAQQNYQTFAETPFDLSTAPLFRARLLRLSEDEHLLYFNTHHIISDAWSLGLFHGEWTHHYTRALRGDSTALPPLPIQYADYAWWQRRHLGQDVLQQQLDWWSDTLADAPTVNFPTDRTRPPRQTYPGALVTFDVSEDVTRGLTQLAASAGATMYMVLLAALKTLIYRYSGEQDLTVGSSIGNRNHPETEGVIGMFVNLPAMRTQIPDGCRFTQLLALVRQTALGAYQHQDVPFEKVVERCRPERDLSRHPLFQIQLVHQRTGPSAPLPEGLNFAPVEEGTGSVSRVDFTLNVTEHDHGLWAGIEYNTDLFDHTTMTTLADHFTTLLAGLIHHPEARLAELPMLLPQEQDRANRINTAAARPFPHDQPLHRLFEALVAQRPDAVAVQSADAALTYTELNQRANLIAQELLDRALGGEALIGVCLDPGVDIIPVLLGILKAGATYVPMDPGYPRERLSFLIQDTGMALLITTDDKLDLLPAYELNFLDLIILDELDLDQADTPNPEIAVDPGQAAYVMYTSGTTGTPKGVQVTHRNISRLVFDTQYLTPKPHNGFAQVSNLSFDAMTFEVWTALLHGARLCPVDKQTYIDADRFTQAVKAQGIDTMFVTTALFNQFAQQSPQLFDTMDTVLFGGERADAEAVRRVLTQNPPQRLVHVYGPTETTTFAAHHHLTELAENVTHVPLGGPIANTALHVVDRNLHPVPVGGVGELMIGGEAPARGYLGRFALTAERFIPDPFSPTPGARLYRSGDLVRRLPDGTVAFYGRVDNQVKIRGFRIELGEIEAVLEQHSAVNAALVLARPFGSDRTIRLAAYIAMVDSDMDLEACRKNVREFLESQLPAYMIPNAIVPMEAFPLTPNGKVNRALLPEPGETRVEKTYTAPTNATEALMVEVWQEVLGVTPVGIHDNFFELGGDSLISIRIKALARERGLDFELQELFEKPTIAELVTVIRRHHGGADTDVAPFAMVDDADRAALPEDVVDAYPLSRLQMGMLYHSAFVEDSAMYHVVLFYAMPGTFHQDAMRRALDHVTRRHEVLRTSYDLNRYSQPLQLVHRHARVPLDVTDLQNETNPESYLENWVHDIKGKPFEWTEAPLFHFHVFTLADQFFFSIRFHHAVMDGWSDAALLAELLPLYSAAINGPLPDPEPAPPPYRNFIALEQEAVNNPEAALFWRRLLEDFQVTRLPRNPQRPKDVPAEPLALDIDLSPQVSNGLNALARDLRAPIKSVLLAAHLKAVSLVTGTRDVTTGLISNGRPETLGGERTLGLFLNNPPFRFQLGRESWHTLVERVFAREREIMPYRRFPLPEIMKQHQGRELFEIDFNFTHFHVLNTLDAEEAKDQTDAGESDSLTSMGGSGETNAVMGVDFRIAPGTTHLQGYLTFDRTQIDEDQARTITHCYAAVLAQMAADPTAQHHRFGFTETDATWRRHCRTRDLDLPQQPVHRLFEARAEAAPQAPAIITANVTLTYDQLNRAANALARRLTQRGVGVGDLVALYAERSPQALIAMLAILKAGAAWLPLDRTWPEARLAFMLEDAEVAAVLLNEAALNHLPPVDAPTVFIDDVEQGDDPQNPTLATPTTSAAYVIYTSGSTGQPKGVVIPHAAMLNHNLMSADAFALTPQDRVLQFSTLSFDTCIEEIFPTLLTGAAVILHDRRHGLTTDEMAQLLVDYRITVLNLPTAWWHAWARDLTFETMPGHLPRLVIVGGEKANPGVLAHWLELTPVPIPWINTYGPTEAAVITTLFPVTERRGPHLKTLPIGRPLTNCRVHVLDSELQPVPVGVPGDLYITGAGLGRGYLNRPDQTALAFVPNPLDDGATPGDRLYRSGDRARFLHDGNLEFLGRADHQVKIRGFRIETAEVEAALARHPAVRQVVVHAPKDQPNVLVAYIVPKDQPPEEAVLRDFLRDTLPEYMIPTVFITLEHLLLTPSGKVDRNALPAPLARDQRRLVPARDLNEKRMVAVWEDLLETAPIGVTDTFHDLGGNSLVAIRLMSRIRAEWGVQLPIAAIFQSPTIATLVRRLDQADHGDTIVPLNRADADSNWFLIHPVGGQVHWYMELAAAMEPKARVYGVQSPGLTDPTAHFRHMDELVTHYAAAIRRIQPNGPYRLAGWSLGGSIAFEVAKHLQAAGETVQNLVLIDALHQPPGLTTDEDLLVRAFLMELANLTPPAELMAQSKGSAHAVLEGLASRDLLPPGMDAAYLTQLFNVYQTNVRLAAEHQRSGVYSGPLTLIRATDTVKQYGPDYGWEPFHDGAAQIMDLDGDHYSLFQDDQAATLAQVLDQTTNPECNPERSNV